MMIIIIAASVVGFFGILVIAFIVHRNRRGAYYDTAGMEPHVTRTTPRVDYSKSKSTTGPNHLPSVTVNGGTKKQQFRFSG